MAIHNEGDYTPNPGEERRALALGNSRDYLPKQAQEGLEAHNQLLVENQQYLSQQLKEAHEYLDKLRVPTNGVDANGNLGEGKREVLTLVQRLTYLQPKKK